MKFHNLFSEPDLEIEQQAHHLILNGRVQGVGFRPFVYRLAHRHDLRGWVRNEAGSVEIFAQGAASALEKFEQELLMQAPPLAQPVLTRRTDASCQTLGAFEIFPSSKNSSAQIHVPPDYFACDDCLHEMQDPNNRRFRYPFINCTQCGPRYTLIRQLPYDRPATTMASFHMCRACRREYENPLDRRFHAEPIACPDCGPILNFVAPKNDAITDNISALSQAFAALKMGKIIAVKGVGGYHLMCDARNDVAIARLRAHKPRPHKPLAVLFPRRGADGLDAVRAMAWLNAEEARMLRDPMRPIVLVRRREAASLSKQIAPSLNEIGVMLPYSPLHHLLLDDFDAPLVATSANVSGEPVLTDNAEVMTRLQHVAEAFLHHDRPIARPADDSVYRVIDGQARPLRLGRGMAPLELILPRALSEPVLAVGGHMKNTVALAWQNRVVVSPHIGDLDAPRSREVFEQVIEDMQSLYQIRARHILCDAHPGYASHRWAKQTGLPVTSVVHHHAHAAAVAGEFPDVDRWLVFTWDGVGLGADNTLWGGEALLGAPGQWRRFASLRPFRLPGGDKAGREPWRSGAALCWELDRVWKQFPEDSVLLRQAWERHLNCPITTAAGRLFDAAAALIGLNYRSSFEGQGPMMLEAICRDSAESITLPMTRNAHGLWESDWAPLVALLLDDKRTQTERAEIFHRSLAQTLLDQARQARQEHGANAIGFAGGVFQNRRLAETALALLRDDGFDVYLGRQLPSNDAAISYGQVIEYMSAKR